MAINHPYEIPGVIAVWHAVNGATDIDTGAFDIPDGVSAWRRMRNPDGDAGETTYDNTIWNAANPDQRTEYGPGKNLINGIPAPYWRAGGRLRSDHDTVQSPLTYVWAGIPRGQETEGAKYIYGAGLSSPGMWVSARRNVGDWRVEATGSAEGSLPDMMQDVDVFTVLGIGYNGAASWVRRNDADKVVFDGTGAGGNTRTSMGAGTTISWTSSFVGEYCTLILANAALTDEQYLDLYTWIRKEWGFSTSPYPGEHTVTNIDNAADPNCIYNGQSPAIVIGDIFSYKQESETNAWPVSIDADGYPIIDAGGGSGTDSFLFDIDRGSGFDDPSEWTFTIGSGIQYTLVPNADGTQRTNYPDGDYTAPSVLPPPTWAAITGITQNSMTVNWVFDATGTDADGFVLQRWIVGTSTSWTSHPASNPQPALAARSSVETGLPPSTEVRFRIASKVGDIFGKFSELFDG